jgi:hypothetical protein
MSKKKPIKKKTKSKSEAKPREVAPNAAMDKSVSYPAAPVSTNDGLLKKVFWYAAGVMFLLTVFLSFNSGINGDDEYQNDYSKKLVALLFYYGC